MAMGMMGLLSAIAPSIFKVVDDAVADKDLARQLKNELSTQLLENESDITEAASKVVMTEASGESWLQRNWRPMLMIWFAFLIGAYWFGFVPVNMAQATVDKLFTLVQIGVGGYVVGRSGEKIAKTVAPALASR